MLTAVANTSYNCSANCHNYVKQPCLCSCNNHEIVWTVSKSTSQNGRTL